MKFGNCKITISPPRYKTIASPAAHFPEWFLCALSHTSKLNSSMLYDTSRVLHCKCAPSFYLATADVIRIQYAMCTLPPLLLMCAQEVCQSLLVIAMGGGKNIASHCHGWTNN